MPARGTLQRAKTEASGHQQGRVERRIKAGEKRRQRMLTRLPPAQRTRQISGPWAQPHVGQTQQRQAQTTAQRMRGKALGRKLREHQVLRRRNPPQTAAAAS